MNIVHNMENHFQQKNSKIQLKVFSNFFKAILSFKSMAFYLLICFFLALLYRDSVFIATLVTITFFLISLKLFLIDSILFKMYFFMFYITYSILIAEYLFPNQFSVNYTFAKTIEIYYILSILFFIFAYINLLMVVFFKLPQSIKLQFVRKNDTIYGVILISLLLIFIFGVDRSTSDENYVVRISSFFEYSKILFIFLFIFSDSPFKKKLSTGSLLLFLIQDLILGGRITTFQLILIAFIFLLSNQKSNILFILFFPLFIIFGYLIAYYRAYGFTLNLTAFFSYFQGNRFFVLDTAIYSYYTSATHIYTKGIINTENLWKTFSDHLLFLFSGIDSSYSSLTSYVNANYTRNIGGGYLLTEYFFWFDYLGVIFFSLAFAFMIYKLVRKSTTLRLILLISIISSSPRWFIYGNSGLVRSSILVPLLAYFLYRIFSFAIRKPKNLILKNGKSLERKL